MARARRMRCAAALLVVVTMLTSAGCKPPDAAVGVAVLDDLPYVPGDVPPDANLARHPAVAAARSGVVKVSGLAYGCQRRTSGTGFVVAPHRVMTNAHVVAGAGVVSVELGGVGYDAQVVSYDPFGDVAILDVPTLAAAPLEFADSLAFAGSDTIMLGYPAGGPFVATPARVRDITELGSMDIYGTTPVVRQVYVVRGTVRHISGAPLVDLHARVLGVVFGAAADDSETGFVLTSDQIAPQLAKSRTAAWPVPTGRCVIA